MEDALGLVGDMEQLVEGLRCGAGEGTMTMLSASCRRLEALASTLGLAPKSVAELKETAARVDAELSATTASRQQTEQVGPKNLFFSFCPLFSLLDHLASH